MTADVFEYTSGGGRSENEDSIGSVCHLHQGMFIVADGLGGHVHGSEASGIAVETLKTEFDFSAASSPESAENELKRVFAEANRRIMAKQTNIHSVMKTTAAVLVLNDCWASWAHIGDSRLYILHQNEIIFCTADHSVAYKKYRAGEITRSQIGSDPDQSSLLRALGGETRNEPDTGSRKESPETGDGFLLCSDGVWAHLHDEEIRIDFLKASGAQEWAELLLLRIMDRAMPDQDNLSIITIVMQP